MRAWLTALLLASLSPASVAAPAATYNVRVLPTTAFQNEMLMTAMNDLGHSLWFVTSGADGSSVGNMFWSPETGYVWVARPNGKLVGAYALNDHDQVVDGSSVWTPHSFAELPPPAGYALFEATAVNNHGLIVGQAIARGNHKRTAAHASPADGVVSDTWLQSKEVAVNDPGDVAVEFYEASCFDYCLPIQAWIDAGGARIPVTAPDGTALSVTAMNDQREAQIWSPQPGYWSQASGFVPIDAPPYGMGHGISNAGEIVGHTEGGEAFIWTPERGMQPLLDLIASGQAHQVTWIVEMFISPAGMIGGTSNLGPVLLVPQR